MFEIVDWTFTDFEPKEGSDSDDRYHYTTQFYGVDYFMDIYVTDGKITDHTCSRFMGEPLGYLYESDFEVPTMIAKDVMMREQARKEAE